MQRTRDSHGRRPACFSLDRCTRRRPTLAMLTNAQAQRSGGIDCRSSTGSDVRVVTAAPRPTRVPRPDQRGDRASRMTPSAHREDDPGMPGPDGHDEAMNAESPMRARARGSRSRCRFRARCDVRCVSARRSRASAGARLKPLISRRRRARHVLCGSRRSTRRSSTASLETLGFTPRRRVSYSTQRGPGPTTATHVR